MAERLTIPYLRDDRWEPGTRLSLRVKGPDDDEFVDQPDRILPWGSPGADRDVEAYGEGVYGFSGVGGGGQGLTALDYGDGYYGAGVYGVGVEQVEHRTLNPFDEGDYQVELTAWDLAGNASDPPPETAAIEHRPIPGPPRNLRLDPLDDHTLLWDWP